MKKVEFVDEGLIFTFTDRIPNVYVKKEKKPKDWPGEGDGLFEQPGYVMKYKLIHVDKDLLQSAGYELRVKYDTGHIISASGLDNLRLGINFEDGKGWQDKIQDQRLCLPSAVKQSCSRYLEIRPASKAEKTSRIRQAF